MMFTKDDPFLVKYQTSWCGDSSWITVRLCAKLQRDSQSYPTHSCLSDPPKLKPEITLSEKHKKDIKSMLPYMPPEDQQVYCALFHWDLPQRLAIAAPE